MKELVLRDGRTIKVRECQEGDQQGIIDFFQSLDPYSDRMFKPFPSTEETVSGEIQKSLVGENWLCVGIDENLQVVAVFFLYGLQEDIPTIGIGVSESCQDQGLGQQLMDILIKKGKMMNKKGVKLTTMTDNDRAFHVYLKKGFRYTGDSEGRLYTGETCMERNLIYMFSESDK